MEKLRWYARRNAKTVTGLQTTVAERETTPDELDCGEAVTDEELVGAETLV